MFSRKQLCAKLILLFFCLLVHMLTFKWKARVTFIVIVWYFLSFEFLYPLMLPFFLLYESPTICNLYLCMLNIPVSWSFKENKIHKFVVPFKFNSSLIVILQVDRRVFINFNWMTTFVFIFHVITLVIRPLISPFMMIFKIYNQVWLDIYMYAQ
jgi:hypothetical protein